MEVKMKLLNLFPYFGGKYRMVKKLLPLFPKHYMYVEPFCGSCVVLLNKSRSNREVINDKYNEIYNLFTVVKNKPDEFYDSFKYTFTSRTYFYDLLNTDVIKLNDVQKAHRFFYFINHVYNSAPTTKMFRSSRYTLSKLNYNSLKERIDSVYDRLKNVYIECLDYKELFDKYDYNKVFYFIDPPYYSEDTKNKNTYEYAHTFVVKDFIELANRLKDIKGKFLMTINDCSFTRNTYKDFKLSTIPMAYSCGSESKGVTKPTELIVSNYDIKPRRWKLK